MKKGLIFFLVAAFLITSGLRFIKNTALTPGTTGTTGLTQTQTETKEVNLNAFLGLYSTGAFEKIVLKDAIKLEGYERLEGVEPQANLFGIKPEAVYMVYTTNKPIESSLADLGISATGAVAVDVEYNEKSILGTVFLEQILPLLFFILILVLAFRFFAPKGGGLPFGIKAGTLRTNLDVKTKFKDVAGMDEVKDELIEIVDFLKDPQKYQKVGAKIPKGVLLYGPPGAGKTLLARAVAGEAGVPFFSASGSEFMEMLVGMGAAKVRELFKKAKTASPSIIFIDEIDTIGRKRGVGYTGGHQEQEQTLNQILTEMDGFDKDTNVIVIAATNRPDILDGALMRSGRFDRKIMVGNPTLEERMLILKLHASDKDLAADADIEALARRTSGFVGADLANILNEAALRIAKDNRKKITMDDLDYALEKVVMGPEKRLKNINEHEKKIVTYHELGHAVTSYSLPHADPVEKISIVSRGMALGVTRMMPTEDTYLYSKAKFLDEMVTLLGGRAAEEIFFGIDNVTTGASNDFEKVTKIAYNMITKYGMDPDLGTLIRYDKDKSELYPFKPFSEKVAEQIDKKVKELVSDAYIRSVAIIEKNKALMDKMAMLLLEKEYLTKEEFMAMMKDPSQIDELIADFKEKHTEKEAEKQKEREENQKAAEKEAKKKLRSLSGSAETKKSGSKKPAKE